MLLHIVTFRMFQINLVYLSVSLLSNSYYKMGIIFKKIHIINLLPRLNVELIKV